MGDTLMRPKEIAKALGVPLPTFYASVVRLRRDEGFPEPLPGMGGRYDPMAIEAWRRQRAKLTPAPTPAMHSDPEIAAMQAILDARSEQFARDGNRK